MNQVSGVEVDAYESADGVHYMVWCSWCIEWHRHGAGEGDRAAHCPDQSSPYRFMPYVLRYAGPFTDEVESAHAAEAKRARQARRKGQQPDRPAWVARQAHVKEAGDDATRTRARSDTGEAVDPLERD